MNMFPSALIGPSHCPEVFKRSNESAMTSLAQRLLNVQKPAEESHPDISHLSLGQLREQKIAFGKAHQGKTFNQMWKEEQGWVTWFVQRFAQSTKAEHRIFLRYVELEIERAELSGDQVPVRNQQETNKLINMADTPPQSSQLGNVAKAKAKPMIRPTPETPVWDLEEDPDLFEMIPTDTGVVQNQQIEHLETRMLNVEGMLNNILQHLENLTVNRCTEQ